MTPRSFLSSVIRGARVPSNMGAFVMNMSDIYVSHIPAVH
jgi:hypothetical protein